MKIIFLCNSLEPGCDGVGDYTKCLASELVNQGNVVSVIALNDKFINEKINNIEKCDNSSLQILRLPVRWSAKERVNYAKSYISKFNPEYISLQFVIYGFHPKGLPYRLGKQLSIIGKNRHWHIMFHEIWPGISKLSPIKHKVYGYLQKKIVKDILKNIEPKVITTSNKLYQIVLANSGIQAKILPLFSNIPIVEDDTFKNALKLKIGYINQLNQKIIGIFGTLYPQANLEKTIEAELKEAKKHNKELIFISFGRIGDEGIHEYNRLQAIFSPEIRFSILGELSAEQISVVFQIMNTGISCTPVQHLGKSGVFAAMRLHELPVITPVNDFVPEYTDEINRYNEYLFLRKPYKWGVKHIAAIFVNLINFKNSDGTIVRY